MEHHEAPWNVARQSATSSGLEDPFTNPRGPIYQPPGTHLLTPGDPKNRKSENSQKSFFSQFRLKLGRSGGVWGERADHTKTLCRTLAGFGLARLQKVNFSTFDGKLEGRFMTKYLQIGFWIFPNTRGFWLNGLRRAAAAAQRGDPIVFHIRPIGSYRAKTTSKTAEKLKILFFTKTVLLTIFNLIWAV